LQGWFVGAYPPHQRVPGRASSRPASGPRGGGIWRHLAASGFQQQGGTSMGIVEVVVIVLVVLFVLGYFGRGRFRR
jgi:hypothetical protein